MTTTDTYAATPRLAGKVALITGAGSVGPGWGNGRATAVRLAQAGALVYGVDQGLRRLAETADIIESGAGLCKAGTCDVTRALPGP